MSDLPLPPVPADCDLRDFPFMPLDVSRLRDSDLAASETPAACWAALLLWAASWHQIPAASIPDDERWIAKQAGYAHLGKIAREWSGVRAGALHNWIKCSDGRLYHPVVAEKALEAWQAKLRQRWSSECARVKKHNQRHPTANVQAPDFEDWKSRGCPTGHPLPVPRDTGDDGGDSGWDKHSKGQGEGQGQGQREKKEENELSGKPDGVPAVPPAKPKASKQTNAAPEYDPSFSLLWREFPQHPNASKKEAYAAWLKLPEGDRDQCLDGAMAYGRFLERERLKRPDHPSLHLATFINQRRFDSLLEAAQ